MKRILLALALVGSLGGCASIETLTGTAVSPTQVIIAGNAFDAVEATATNYLKLPACPGATVCRSAAGVAAVVPAIRSGRQARNALEAYVNANPGQPAPVTLYQAVITATTTLQGLLAQYNAGA